MGTSNLYGQNLSVDDKMTRARIQMYHKSPFFTCILLHMKFQEKKGMPMGTMSVDAKGNLYWDRKWVEGLPEEELMGVIAHEVLHIALMHLTRVNNRDRHIFNVCNDIVNNDILINEGFALPKCGCIPKKGKHTFDLEYAKGKKHKVMDIEKRSSEDIYDEVYDLMKNNKPPKGNKGQQTQGDGSGGTITLSDDDKDGSGDGKGFDDHQYDESSDKEGENGERAKREGEWRQIITSAATLAKMQGKLPAGLERLIDGVMETKIGWKEKLYKYLVSDLPYDYTWRMPSKKSIVLGTYLPRVVKENIHVVVSVDTSGSIDQKQLTIFLSEIVAIALAFPNIILDIIVCDADIHETYTLTNDNIEDIMALKMSGGGGTDHRPIYEYVEKEIIDCKILVNFTDGATSFPQNPENYSFDSLWILCGEWCIKPEDIPFGDVIRVES